jgi:hypothetical protein
MGRRPRKGASTVLIEHPFLLIGVLTGLVWFMVEKQYLEHVPGLAVAILPMYLVRLAVVVVENVLPIAVPRWIDWLTIPLLILPYLLLDAGLRRVVRSSTRGFDERGARGA